jgi:ActR/RegA family two-component response regulator/GGDEF domain-containing protein
VSDKILFVDDESSALEGFQRILHRRFDIRTAISGGEGLVAIDRDGPFAVVISDMRMPGMGGADFLAQVRRRSPETVRMLLTGHADLHSAIDAVNRGQILHFLTKPCERDVLVAAINSGLDQYHAVMAEKALARKGQLLEGSRASWESDDPWQGDGFASPADLPGPAQAKSYLEPLVGADARCYVVLLRLAVLQTVERRYGESAAGEYVRIVSGFLQQTLQAGDRLFHWRRDVLMAVLRRQIAPAAVRMELERLIAETRGYIIEVHGRPMMIACLITFDLLPAAQFAGFGELAAACDSRITGRTPEPAAVS